MRFYTIIFLLLTSFLQIQAQVQAPNLLCITGDSLIFRVPDNTCGTFNAYEVYGSKNRSGPYNLLGTITEKIKSSFVHSGVGNETWYYYMQSDFNCPSVTILKSDTLDNLTPDVSPLKSISIENDSLVFINWFPSLSPQTIGYVIYRVQDAGTQPIDTVLFSTAYVDIFAKPNEGSEEYFVIAMDACGNTSEFVESHQSIFLQTTVSPCEQSITLNWNLYKNWVGGIEAHEIWVSIDSGVAERLAVLQGSENSYIVQNITSAVTYSFFVKSIEAGTGVDAKSNQVTTTPDIVNDVGDLLLKNVTFTDNNEVELIWEWTENAELKSAEIFRSFDNVGFESSGIPNFTAPLDDPATFLVDAANTIEAKTFFRINTIDNCDSSTISNYASTIFLSGATQPNRENLLTWTPYDSKAGTASSYSIYKLVDNIPVFVGRVDGNTNTFSDPIINVADANACYFVEADITIPFAKSGIEMLISRSNTTCLSQSAGIIMPNAFAPNGRNQIFKPTILFGEGIQNYQLAIYNRYGGKIFESRDISTGWNGQKDGKFMPQGTYSYFLRIEQSNGQLIEKGGVLMLLR